MQELIKGVSYVLLGYCIACVIKYYRTVDVLSIVKEASEYKDSNSRTNTSNGSYDMAHTRIVKRF